MVINEQLHRLADADNQKDLAAIRSGETPVPMPNTTVKTRSADGTAPETVRESRWPPELVFLSNLLLGKTCRSAGGRTSSAISWEKAGKKSMGKARSRTHLENRIYDLASDAKASCADKR